MHARLTLVGPRVGRARRTGGNPVAAARHGILVGERRPHVEAVAVGGPLREHELVERASVVGEERHAISFVRDHPAVSGQPSSNATARSTGTDPMVVRNTVSRATTSAVS